MRKGLEKVLKTEWGVSLRGMLRKRLKWFKRSKELPGLSAEREAAC